MPQRCLKDFRLAPDRESGAWNRQSGQPAAQDVPLKFMEMSRPLPEQSTVVVMNQLDNARATQPKLLRQHPNDLLQIIENILATVPSQEGCVRFD